MKPIYDRVLLKISGEALAGQQRFGINEAMTRKVAQEVKQIHDLGVQVAIVVGGGNFWRGRTSKDMDRATADYMGMLVLPRQKLPPPTTMATCTPRSWICLTSPATLRVISSFMPKRPLPASASPLILSKTRLYIGFIKPPHGTQSAPI